MTAKICVILPAYNAAASIGAIVAGALRHVPKVLVADDGSTDSTALVAAAAGAEVLRLEKNRGKGHALKVLFAAAAGQGYEAVISMDADGQHDPDDIPRFLAAHARQPGEILVGTRMRDQEKIPRARYNSMRIARFYVSLGANQFLEDTQCGYRLYPLALLQRLRLLTERFVTETEVLMKAGDSGAAIGFVPIQTIYGDHGSHFRPIADIAAITTYVISYIMVKWLLEGITNRPTTYHGENHPRDRINQYPIVDLLFRAVAAMALFPASILFLLAYHLSSPLGGGNFTSVRQLGSGYATIVLANWMLPVLLGITIIEQLARRFCRRLNLVDGFISQFYPHLWTEDEAASG